MKHRIVEKIRADGSTCFAVQGKLFGLFWVHITTKTSLEDARWSKQFFDDWDGNGYKTVKVLDE